MIGGAINEEFRERQDISCFKRKCERAETQQRSSRTHREGASRRKKVRPICSSPPPLFVSKYAGLFAVHFSHSYSALHLLNFRLTSGGGAGESWGGEFLSWHYEFLHKNVRRTPCRQNPSLHPQWCVLWDKSRWRRGGRNRRKPSLILNHHARDNTVLSCRQQ